MFERRLKVLLGVLAIVGAVLVGRAAYVQVVCGREWVDEAAKTARHERLIDTTRGRLLDYKGKTLAEDVACIDACVDYHVIGLEPDTKWVHDLAVQRVKARLAAGKAGLDAEAGGGDRTELVAAEDAKIRDEIAEMWKLLAQVSGQRDSEMDEAREAITSQVERRRGNAEDRKYNQEVETARGMPGRSWLGRLLGGGGLPNRDKTFVDVSDAEQSYPILRAIKPEVYNELGKEAEHLPGLSLRPAMERKYPWKSVACQVIGQMARVDAADIKDDPNRVTPQGGDALRSYEETDLVGRSGLEALCEPLLRGSRGRIETQGDLAEGLPEGGTQAPSTQPTGSQGDDAPAAETRSDPVAGADVRTTIDIELQQEIEKAFDKVTIKDGPPENPISKTLPMHGAAVVIDIASGEVRAMVSVPGYDVNEFDEKYDLLSQDELNKPLMNRATQAALEPGSTVKPMVGIGAITQGLFTVDSRVHCNGYLVINGRQMPSGRCWTMNNFRVPGHLIPSFAPHPTSNLCFPEALERSCNVYFETVADRLGLDGLSRWYLTFGIGRPTGIGIPEVLGRLPDSLSASVPEWVTKNTTWFCGIGQGYVAATPLQMCNAAATIARDGVWMRPRLVSDEEDEQMRSALRLGQRGTIDVARLGEGTEAEATALMSGRDVPDRIDLGLSKDALAAARLGMIRVVNSPGGTGTVLRTDDDPTDQLFDRLVVAGKTGTAQAAPLRLLVRDPGTGKYEVDEKGRLKRIEVTPSTLLPMQINLDAPWYFAFNAAYATERRQQHSWFIGFAPADHPRIAFAVLVEYGGSGGGAAGCVARKLLAACVEHGYVPLSTPEVVKSERDAVSGFTVGGDLLHDINSIAVAPSALAEPAVENAAPVGGAAH